MAKRSFLREFMTLSSSLADDFQDQVKLLPIDDSNLRLFEVEISPKKGVYAHAVFRFLINVPDAYPNKPPAVSCLTPVFHPNIDAVRHLDNVCLNITDCWNRSFGLKSFLQALLFLFYEPNFEDPIDSFTSVLPEGTSFEHCVHLSLMGGTINSVTYEINQSWCKWAEENGFSLASPTKPEQVRSESIIFGFNKAVYLLHSSVNRLSL
ncbi:Ubiquitin--protein ligase [Paragonimus heterotremus]|uniref:Ubiquitin--protein ligase n=1 Tax=Paragonimus heterotremus TaxID=100268 RepID=A0A8J4WD35_9TREM|nr:Ubiquitin--protein ligase [Paragonimus heterotremus]